MTIPNEPGLAVRNFLDSFFELRHLPRAFWFVIGAFVLEVSAYYGVLTLMTTYLSTDLGWGDSRAGVTVSVFTMLVTLFMLGAGSYAEGYGLRQAIIFALFIASCGRALYGVAPRLGGGALVAGAVLMSLVAVAMGEAILQPVCYSCIKQYTNEKTHSVGYGLIYSVMNLGLVGMGTLSARLRPAVQRIKDHSVPAGQAPASVPNFFAGFSATVVQAVNWACCGITVLALLGFLVLMTRRVEAAKVRPDHAEEMRLKDTMLRGQRLKVFFAGGPFSNPRFIFFVFMLLPVRTLFAHQWLTMPQYIVRAYDKGVADHMEWLVNWINPGIIFFGVPIATALTRRVNVYRMMIIGSLVSAAPAFLLMAGPDLPMLITYLVVFSIGEALWSARFLEYAAELAPPGRIAQYMGMANIRWPLAKGTTGMYSGAMLANFCPPNTPADQLHTGTMWLTYGCVAMTSPIGLWAARKWVVGTERNPP